MHLDVERSKSNCCWFMLLLKHIQACLLLRDMFPINCRFCYKESTQALKSPLSVQSSCEPAQKIPKERACCKGQQKIGFRRYNFLVLIYINCLHINIPQYIAADEKSVPDNAAKANGGYADARRAACLADDSGLGLQRRGHSPQAAADGPLSSEGGSGAKTDRRFFRPRSGTTQKGCCRKADSRTAARSLFSGNSGTVLLTVLLSKSLLVCKLSATVETKTDLPQRGKWELALSETALMLTRLYCVS